MKPHPLKLNATQQLKKHKMKQQIIILRVILLLALAVYLFILLYLFRDIKESYLVKNLSCVFFILFVSGLIKDLKR